MTSMRKLRRRMDRWLRYANRVAPGARANSWLGNDVRTPSGLLRAMYRYDEERLRRNLAREEAQDPFDDDLTEPHWVPSGRYAKGRPLFRFVHVETNTVPLGPKVPSDIASLTK